MYDKFEKDFQHLYSRTDEPKIPKIDEYGVEEKSIVKLS